MGRAALSNPHFCLPIREEGTDGWIDATDLFLVDDERLCDLDVGLWAVNAWGTTNSGAPVG